MSSPPLNADLHCHSVMSDGTLSPEALAQRAAANGVQLWSLTDHDEIKGQDSAKASAQALGLAYLTGVEVSVTFAGQTVHVLGLGFDHTHPELVAGLDQTRGGRVLRAQEMAQSLAQVGIQDAFEGALKYVGNPELVSRTHFARYLVDAGVCKDTHEVFRKYLTEGKPGYVPHRWANLGDTVRWITQAAGMAIIAHPARYPFGPTEEYALFSEFIAHGGQGVEVITGAHTSADAQKYAALCTEMGLYASRGSDFHSPNESHTDLGHLPQLPPGLTPVWEVLAERIHLPH